jgi:hypothetical protein
MTRRLTERTIDYAGELNAAQFEMILGLCDLPRERHKPGADHYVFASESLREAPIYNEVCEALLACGGSVKVEEVYEVS